MHSPPGCVKVGRAARRAAKYVFVTWPAALSVTALRRASRRSRCRELEHLPHLPGDSLAHGAVVVACVVLAGGALRGQDLTGVQEPGAVGVRHGAVETGELP